MYYSLVPRPAHTEFFSCGRAWVRDYLMYVLYYLMYVLYYVLVQSPRIGYLAGEAEKNCKFDCGHTGYE